MTTAPFIGFLNNAALLLALGVLYSFFRHRSASWPWKISRGIMLGIVAVGVMINPWELKPGVIFDTRPIVLSVGGMFLGAIPTLIASAIASVYRLYLGGAGAITGTLWVLVSAAWGLCWLRLRKRPAWQISGVEYYFLGLSLGIVLLLLMFTMPNNLAVPILNNISLPLLIIFPIVTVLLSKLFAAYDIQEQNRLAIAESERKYKELIEQTKAILIRVDMQGLVTFINEYAQKLFGFEPHEILGKNIVGTIVFAADHSNALSLEKPLNVSETLQSNENVCKDGQRVAVEWKHTLLQDGEGQDVGFQFVGHDVTEKNKLQAQAIRASHLASIGELSAGLAHEINNPISGVINYAIILKSRVEEDEHKNLLERIIREGGRVAKIVKSLLSYARDDKGDYKRHDISEIINEPYSLMREKLKYDGISVEISIPEDIEKIHCNAHQIEQVLLNLFSNAQHALNKKFPKGSKDKKIDIVVTQAADKSERKILKMEFTDNGTGMPEEALSQIFNSFFTTKKAGVGTGLGLSICKDIIDLHGGTIEVQSRCSDFTKFTIALPFING